MLGNVTIKAKLGFVIGTVCVLLIVIGFIGLEGMSRANDALRSVYEDRTVAIKHIAQVDRNIAGLRLQASNALLDTRPDSVKSSAKRITEDLERMGKDWAAFYATEMTADEKKLADAFSADLERMKREGVEPTLAALKASNLEEANRVYMGRWRELNAPTKIALEKLQSLQLSVAQEEVPAGRQSLSRDSRGCHRRHSAGTASCGCRGVFPDAHHHRCAAACRVGGEKRRERRYWREHRRRVHSR